MSVSTPTGRIFMKFDICELFENLLWKFQIHSNLTRITCALCKDLCTFMMIYRRILLRIRGGADKSLARSSIHFLARCSIFYKPLKKKIRRLSVQPGFRGSNDLRVGRKMATFQLFFFLQSREQVLVRQGQIRRIGWVIRTLEVQVGQFLLGCKCPVSRGIVVQEQNTFGDLPRRFSFKMSFSCTNRDE